MGLFLFYRLACFKRKGRCGRKIEKRSRIDRTDGKLKRDRGEGGSEGKT